MKLFISLFILSQASILNACDCCTIEAKVKKLQKARNKAKNNSLEARITGFKINALNWERTEKHLTEKIEKQLTELNTCKYKHIKLKK